MKRRVTVRLRGPAARSSYLAEDVLDVRGVLGGGGGLAGLHGGAVHAAGRAARQLQHTLVSRPASLPRPPPVRARALTHMLQLGQPVPGPHVVRAQVRRCARGGI